MKTVRIVEAMPMISIIIPAFNAEKYIYNCIKSAADQTLRDLEIIVINDGSTDNTGSIIEKMAREDGRIVCINTSNKGVSFARNSGLSISRGKWIMFLDADDYLDISICERLLYYTNQSEVDMVFCNLINILQDSRMRITPFVEKKRAFHGKDVDVLKKNLIAKKSETGQSLISLSGPYCKIFRRELVKGLLFPDNVSLGEDTCFILSYMDSCKYIIYINEFLYYRNVIDGSLSNKTHDEDTRLAAFTNWVEDRYGAYDDYRRYVNTLNAKNLLRITTHYLNDKEDMDLSEQEYHIERYKSLVTKQLTIGEISNAMISKNSKLLMVLIKFRLYCAIKLLRRIRN